MTTKTRYEIATGKITYSIETNDPAVLFPEEEGFAWINGKENSTTHVVVNGQFVPRDAAELEAEEIARAWVMLRDARDRRLSASDWTQVADAPVDHVAWAAYRQALRDMPANTEDPRNPVWPTPPTT